MPFSMLRGGQWGSHWGFRAGLRLFDYKPLISGFRGNLGLSSLSLGLSCPSLRLGIATSPSGREGAKPTRKIV